MPLRQRLVSVMQVLPLCAFIFSAAQLHAADVWDSPAFSVDPVTLRQASAAIQPAKDAEAIVLLTEWRLSYDVNGRVVETWRMIFRIEDQAGVEDWSEVRASWEPWYQARPEIKARVITADGSVHVLDPKTLNDVPEHENTPDVYSDQRAYGGPLPAVAPGAIVEEEIVTRDTQVFFKAGNFERFYLSRRVPVERTRFVFEHPQPLSLRYALYLLPQAKITKSVANGVEMITIENGPLEAVTDHYSNVPSDVVLHPKIEISTGTSWQQVASEYAGEVNEKLRVGDVQPLLAKIGVTGLPRDEKIRRIVSLLHQSVRYTGIEFGESSLIPQFPGETLKRKYGDCKDKSALLVAMLRAVSIPASMALLSSGPGQDVTPELPGMGAFDHAIVYIPATPSTPELWIDATAQYSQVGSLPEMDYGRWALIVDEKTTALKKIPQLTAGQNLHIETREFTLAGYGPAKVVETNEGVGLQDSGYREYYSGDSKKIRENSEQYMQDAYLADSLGSVEKGDPTDLDKPFKVTLTATGRRGFTDLDNAVVYIPYAAIFNGFPDYFKIREDEDKQESQDKPKPRTFDWSIAPFATEWRYKIAAPDGFKIRALPSDKSEPVGTARFTQKFSASPDGSHAEVVLRLESNKERLTVEEGKALRDAVLKERKADSIVITFDQSGHSLLSAGRVREALAVDRLLVAEHPRDALHKVRLARVLLVAGLGDKARAVARDATQSAPDSARAFNELGWILQHDLLGRRFKKGFDYDGAVAAYRKAKQLDPKDKPLRADLAILLEYDPEGVPYSPNAHLSEAIAEFQELKKLNAEYFHGYEDNIAYDLLYSGKFNELGEYLAGLPGSDARRSLALAAMAATQGAEAALKKSLEITSEEKDRSKALVTAGYLLLRLRRYSEAAALYRAGAEGQENSARLLASAEIIGKTRHYEEVTVAASDPRSAVQRLFITTMISPSGAEEWVRSSSKVMLELYEQKDLVEKAERTIVSTHNKLAAAQVPEIVSLDLAIANAKYTAEGDDSLGYRITLQIPGAAPQQVYVVREDGQYKVLNPLGHQSEEAVMALERLKKNDLTGARKWLDWMRADVHLGGGDDPLAGPVFPRFWTKGQEGDATSVRLAALSALTTTKYIGAHLTELAQARDMAQRASERNNLNLALAFGYSQVERWPDLLAVSEELMKAFPESGVAYEFAVTAYMKLNRLDDWQKLVEARLQKHPDEPEYIRSQARLEVYRHNVVKSRSILKSLIDQGKAGPQDLNQFSWFALELGGKIDDESMEVAERANNLTQNSDFGVMHTVVCLYAARGKTKEARELLLKAMDAGSLREPNDAVWLALGMIAEQYGEFDAAREIYGRLQKPKVESPGSSYELAQKFLVGLPNSSTPGPKTSGR